MKLTRWIIDNKEKWEIICRMSDKRFTVEEVTEILEEMKKLTELKMFRNEEFSAIFMVILYQYFYEIFPNAPRD